MKRQKHKESKRKNGLIKEIVLFLLLKQSCPIPIEEKAISYRMTDKQDIPFIVKIKNKEMNRIKKPSPLVGEGGGEAVGRGKCEQTRKNGFYRAALNTCLSFLNEVMASEPLSGEQSDAAKVSKN